MAMNKSVALDFNTQSGLFTVIYDIANNPIAEKWFNKIQLLQEQNIIVSSELTSSFYGKSQPYEYYKQILDTIVDWVNTNATNYHLDKKDYYTQEDLCIMHDVYVALASDPLYDSYTETYLLNKYIHICEGTLHGPAFARSFIVSWGINDGATMERFDNEDYQYYTTNLIPGSIYLCWSELGKTPHDYWRDCEEDDLENFLKLTTPHKSWSAHCRINLARFRKQPKEFWEWFSKYKEHFLVKWGLADWTDRHESGGIELAHLRNLADHKRLQQEFVSLTAVRILD